MTKANRLTTL